MQTCYSIGQVGAAGLPSRVHTRTAVLLVLVCVRVASSVYHAEKAPPSAKSYPLLQQMHAAHDRGRNAREERDSSLRLAGTVLRPSSKKPRCVYGHELSDKGARPRLPCPLKFQNTERPPRAEKRHSSNVLHNAEAIHFKCLVLSVLLSAVMRTTPTLLSPSHRCGPHGSMGFPR